MENKYFNRALSNFVQDMASGAAIRHLADQGYTVEQIRKHLSYPTTEEQIGKTVWAHYVDTGVIFLDEPPKEPVIEKVTYVKEYGKYGAVHFRQKKELVDNPVKEYLPCEFGKLKYQNEALFLKNLEKLSKSDRDYILGLPWPLKTVWHVADERMRRIFMELQHVGDTGNLEMR